MTGIGDPRPDRADRLIRALADVIRSAHENQWALLKWWVRSGEPLLQRCSCRDVVDEGQCVCKVEFEADARWTCVARTRVQANRHPGHTPSQRCPVCRADDHLLAPRYEIEVSVAGGGPTWTHLMPNYATYTRRDHKKRAAGAGGYPPGSADEQLQRALGREP
jgi:hypothetical protein